MEREAHDLQKCKEGEGEESLDAKIDSEMSHRYL